VLVARGGLTTGRPRKRPARTLADRAYSSKANRAYLREHKVQAVIPIKEDQRRTGSSAARPAAASVKIWLRDPVSTRAGEGS
jgi:hypothetical protein